MQGKVGAVPLVAVLHARPTRSSMGLDPGLRRYDVVSPSCFP
jgi:hypothetical protein